MNFTSSFLQVLQNRGFLHQCTDYTGVDKVFTRTDNDSVVSAYLGFDATAKSLHVGSLVQIMLLRHLQKCGHKPVILIGGGTTKIGDPSGKDEARNMLSENQIQENIIHISQIFEKYLSFGNGPTDAVIVNNADWLDNINYLEFLRTYGSYFTINRMLSFESVKQRLDREQPMTFLEFNYMLLQAYDFLKLYQSKYNVRVQIGGSDQWGNIINGIELARKYKQVQLYGITAPLITNSNGKKMGKTASGAVWLDKQLLSEYDYWQFWRNTPDSDVAKFLYLFTEIPTDEIVNLLAEVRNTDGGINDVKIRLADEATQMLHGKDCLGAIHDTSQGVFAHGGENNTLSSLPRVKIRVRPELGSIREGTIGLPDILLQAAIASSKADAKRKIAAGSIRIEGEKCIDTKKRFHVVESENLTFKISSGKKKHLIIIVELESIK